MSPRTPLSPRAAWALLHSLDGLAGRLLAVADALDVASAVEAGWLRGAAVLVERGEEARRSARASALWLEALAPEARARKASLHRAWVDAAGALRAAAHLLDTERGPLSEALFPEWRAPALRRHLDQTLVAEAEVQRRLSSGYVVRRLGEPATERALRPALEALALAQASWSAGRDRPALAGAEADEVLARLLAVAEETARTLDRVRSVVRAALADRPDLAEAVFPGRARAPAVSSHGSTEHPAGTALDADAARGITSAPDVATAVVAPGDDGGAPDVAGSVVAPGAGRGRRASRIASATARAPAVIPGPDRRGRASRVGRGSSERPRPAAPGRPARRTSSANTEAAPTEIVASAAARTPRKRRRAARPPAPTPPASPAPASARPRAGRAPPARRS